MLESVKSYIDNQSINHQKICELITININNELIEAENKIWHSHPVWFINGNPIVGFSIQKKGVRLMFWSGLDFEDEKLNVLGGKFKDASIFYNHISELNLFDLNNWLKKSREIRWDYKNIVKRKGKLEKII
jgi:hypothetical protein